MRTGENVWHEEVQTGQQQQRALGTKINKNSKVHRNTSIENISAHTNDDNDDDND